MSVLESVITWLAPPICISCGREGASICEGCASAQLRPFGVRCWRCNKLSSGARTCPSCRHTGSPGRVWIYSNYEGLARKLLSVYKFGQQRAAAEPIARLMITAFLEAGGQSDVTKDYIVVPVPTATTRVRERGFDHTERLADNLAAQLRLRKINALRRLDQTRQLGARRQDRLMQLSNSFAVKNRRLVRDRHILLIDDVLTTGGTLVSAARTLRGGGAKTVDALLFAKRL